MASTEQISKSLMELESCPSESVRQMLLEGLPHAFGADRHSYQVEFAKLLRQHLDIERDVRLETQQKSISKSGEVKSQLEESRTELSAAEETVKTARAVLEESAAALSAKQAAAKEEEKLYLEAKADKDAALLKREKLETEKAEVDSVANGSLQMLVNGSWEDKDACDDFVSAVYEYLKSMNCEAPLLAALPKALAQRPAERRLFDDVVFEEVARIIGEKVTTMTSAIDQAQEEFEDIKATDLGAWAIWDVACDEEAAAAKSHECAQDSLKQAEGTQSSLAAKIAEQNTLLEEADLDKVVAETNTQEIGKALAELDRLESGEIQEQEKTATVQIENGVAVPSDKWELLPQGVPAPRGCEYKMDMSTGTNMVRLVQPKASTKAAEIVESSPKRRKVEAAGC